MQFYGDWISKFVKKIPFPRIIYGTGIGGSFVLEFLSRYPDLVQGAILHSPVGSNLDKRLFPKVMKLKYISYIVKKILSSRFAKIFLKQLIFKKKLKIII